MAVFELLAAQCPFKAVAPVLALGLVEIQAPQVWTLKGIVALETNSGIMIYEAGAESVPPTH